jgi:hypothetical protein
MQLSGADGDELRPPLIADGGQRIVEFGSREHVARS